MLGGYVCQRVVCSYVSIESVDRLHSILTVLRFSPHYSKLSGRMSREHRLETMKRFLITL